MTIRLLQIASVARATGFPFQAVKVGLAAVPHDAELIKLIGTEPEVAPLYAEDRLPELKAAIIARRASTVTPLAGAMAH